MRVIRGRATSRQHLVKELWLSEFAPGRRGVRWCRWKSALHPARGPAMAFCAWARRAATEAGREPAVAG
eukprot:2638599-Alexandrium_andersonii.AAC.1